MIKIEHIMEKTYTENKSSYNPNLSLKTQNCP